MMSFESMLWKADHEWSEENIEFAIKVRLIKETDMEIIQVAEAEDEDMDLRSFQQHCYIYFRTNKDLSAKLY